MNDILTVDEVEQMFDPIVANGYKMAPDYAMQRLSDNLRALAGLSDDDLHHIGAGAVRDSAFWNSRGGNHFDAHCYVDAVMRECERRGLTEHAADCPAVRNRYQRAWNAAVRSEGHTTMARPLPACACSGTRPVQET